jgi:hypothetical protein
MLHSLTFNLMATVMLKLQVLKHSSGKHSRGTQAVQSFDQLEKKTFECLNNPQGVALPINLLLSFEDIRKGLIPAEMF